jgi:hypothetical protein
MTSKGRKVYHINSMFDLVVYDFYTYMSKMIIHHKQHINVSAFVCSESDDCVLKIR